MKAFTTLIALTSLALAAPAFQDPVKIKQHDGGSFRGYVKGDEAFHWIEDTSGHVIRYNNESKRYEYAKLVEKDGEFDLAPSGIAVARSDRKLASSIYPSQRMIEDPLPKVDKKILYTLWKKRKEKALKHGK